MSRISRICIFLMLLVLVTAFTGCDKKSEKEGKKEYSNMYALQNNLECMNISGAVGDVLTANEINWIHQVLNDNPNLFGAFNDPDGNTLNKTPWHGEFPGKLLSGIAQTYLLNNDEETKKVGDQFVEALKNAQWEDGYLGPWTTETRFDGYPKASPGVWGTGIWDTWGHYHCIYGLLRWYQITGNKDALDVAIKAGDCVYNYFIKGDISITAQNWAECNLAIGHAFTLLYEETNNSKYLKAAERIVDVDWNTPYLDYYQAVNVTANWLRAALEGKTFAKSGQPRWEGIYSLETLAELYKITRKEEYRQGLESLWWGMVKSDRHNTGSFGTGEGATNDLYGNGTETCNTVAWMAFSTEFLKYSKDSYVADELEMSFYNAALGSLRQGERDFTYFNPSDGIRDYAKTTLEFQAYDGARDMSCCQANGNRGITQVTEWAVLTGTDGLYLNYYGECEMNTVSGTGNNVTIKEETVYPKDGNVKITVIPDEPEAFRLFVRIPTWSGNTVVILNGEKMSGVKCGEYYAIDRTWNAGDTVELSLDMSPHFWVAENSKLKPTASVYAGPILLALRMDGEARTTIRFNSDELKKMTPCEGNGMVNYSASSYSGESVVLMDYYSAGKDGCRYITWLTCITDIPVIHDEKGSTPIWCNR